jgi:transposase InsO family protein
MHALPESYSQQLHPSQISRYRNHFDVKQHFGNELINIADEVMDACKQMNGHKLDRKVIQGYLRLSVTMRRIFSGAKNFHKTTHAYKDQIVETVQRIQDVIPVDKCAKIIGVATSTLRNWITSVRVRCSGSLVNLCRKVHPQQISSAETDAMSGLLKDEMFFYWPLVSLYYHALRNKIVSMSLSTWYKYAGLLAIRRLKPKSIKHYTVSISATAPNQYWHADVTLHKTDDGTLHYIYLVVDNFSRMVLSWAINTKLSAQIRADTFRQALKTAINHHPSIETINLIVDGGSENNNVTVDEFLSNLDTIAIHKIRALKDVAYSNSHAEAVNKTLKNYYLNQLKIPATDCLTKHFADIVLNYNTICPHGRIQGLTPLESFTGTKVNHADITLQLSRARKDRIVANRLYSCQSCRF